MSMYKAEYDTRLLYSQSYSADEGLFVSTDCYAVMWTYPQALSPTTTRVRLTYIYTDESGGITPVQDSHHLLRLLHKDRDRLM